MLRLSALVGVTGISFAAIFVRLADVSPTTATFFRVVYALPFLGAIWFFSRDRDDRPPRARLIAFAAGLVFTVDLTLWHTSIDLIGAGLATVLANTQVVFVGVIAWVAHSDRPSRLAIGSVPIILIGVMLIAGVGGGAYGDDPRLGAILGVLTGVSYAGFIVLLRMANRFGSAPPVGPLLDATAGAALGAFLWSFAEADFSFTPTWPSHGWILLLAVVSQTIGWLLISRTLPRLAALETSLLILVQPAGALIWSRLIFSESLSPLQWLGVGVVLGGVAAVAGRTTARITPPATASPRST